MERRLLAHGQTRQEWMKTRTPLENIIKVYDLLTAAGVDLDAPSTAQNDGEAYKSSIITTTFRMTN